MRLAALSLLLVGYFLSPAAGWGYLFNRFRPEATGYGYGGAGLANPPQERVSPRDQLLQTLLAEEMLEEGCAGQRCTTNDFCCEGHICVGYDTAVNPGICMATSSHRRLMDCSTDVDCKEGYVCELGECTPSNTRKSYNEACHSSSECDGDRGLCCQLVRRHRQAPRKQCDYFQDSRICIGHVEVEPMKRSRSNQ